MAGDLTLKIEYLTDDGDVREAELAGSQRTWMCLADRVRFEQRFSTTAGAVWGELVDGEGNLKPDADMSKLSESHTAFFAWCEARRRDSEGTPAEFEDFLACVASIDVVIGEGPTEAAEEQSAA